MTWLIVFFLQAKAADIPGEPVFEAKPSQTRAQTKTNARKATPELGNLPTYQIQRHSSRSLTSELIIPPKSAVSRFAALKVGEKLDAIINHSVIAFPDERSPVVAELLGIRYRGIKLIGESRLEPNSERVFLEFKTAVVKDKTYTLKALGLTSTGVPGFKGEYHSRESELFAGEFISSFAAGYFDGLVPRQKNVFGQVEEDTTVNSAVKKGLASGSLSTANRFKEKLKKVPEFSELRGPIVMEVLILDKAIGK